MGLYSDKLWAAALSIDTYNHQIEAEGIGKPVDAGKFVSKLQLYGGLADELLRQCTWEDLENCGLPRLLARKVSKIFRSEEVTRPDKSDITRISEKYGFKSKGK